jgi:molybdopterin molybdotransferase
MWQQLLISSLPIWDWRIPMPPSKSPTNPPTPRTLLDDCFLHDRDRLRHEEALTLLRERLSPIAATMSVDLENATGFFLAEPIHANRNIPGKDNSAVDGYAHRAADFPATGGFFPVLARIAAGDKAPVELPANAAMRIFTGAVMPQGADTVAMQEDCEPHEQDGHLFVAIPPGLRKGANRRKAGEDLADGALIADAGSILDPQTIAAIASTGFASISAYKPLKIGLFSSGNELKRPGTDADAGEVYDANHFLLRGLLKPLPVEVTDLGIQPDNYQQIEMAIAEAARTHDVIIASGGASKGEEDHMVSALDALGKRHLWQLAVKPGRPMVFGQIGKTLFFGLPGNPVASFVCYLFYVRPSLMLLGGANWPEPRRYFAQANFSFPKKKPDRREFWRGIYSISENGIPVLDKFQRDGSGLITGLREANCLIEVPEETTSVAKGDLLRFIPFSEFGI